MLQDNSSSHYIHDGKSVEKSAAKDAKRDAQFSELRRLQKDLTNTDNFEAPFLPHSENTVFGMDNADQYWEHYVQNNFHARVLHQLSPDLIHFPALDNYMGEFIKRRVCMGIELQELDQ